MTPMTPIALIAAVADNGAIGRNQQLLCHLPNDLKHFKTLTSGHTVVMGRRTFESLPKGALPNRRNIVLTHNPGLSWPGVEVVHSLDEVAPLSPDERIFIIGGATPPKQTNHLAEHPHITPTNPPLSHAHHFFPPLHHTPRTKKEVQEMPADERHAYPYTFVTYRRKR